MTTADERVQDQVWQGAVRATALHGELRWGVVPDAIPIADLGGTLDLASVAQLEPDAYDVALRVFLSGVDGELHRVSFDAAYARGRGKLASRGVSVLLAPADRDVPASDP